MMRIKCSTSLGHLMWSSTLWTDWLMILWLVTWNFLLLIFYCILQLVNASKRKERGGKKEKKKVFYW